MKSSGSPTPVTEFAIGPHAPPAVAAAKEKFDDVASRYTEAKSDLKAARQAVDDAKAADIQAAADSYANGKEPAGSS